MEKHQLLCISLHDQHSASGSKAANLLVDSDAQVGMMNKSHNHDSLSTSKLTSDRPLLTSCELQINV